MLVCCLKNGRILSMKFLDWDSLDFLYCLEVEPVLEDNGLEWHYEAQKNGLVLSVIVVPHCYAVFFSVTQQDQPIPLFSFWLQVAQDITRGKDKRGEYLSFNRCKMISDAYGGDEENANCDLTLELFVKPAVRLNFVV